MTITIHRQRGAALLIFFVIMFSAAAAVILRALNNVDFSQRQRLEVRQDILATKELLIASTIEWAKQNKAAGRFPCPDANNDGAPDASCSGSPIIGRLPKYFEPETGVRVSLTTPMQDPDEAYWYSVSPIFASSGVINSTTSTALTLDDEAVVAVLIAPGPALPGQNRSNTTVAANYLESSNVGGTTFVSSWPANPSGFNDQVVPIYRHEVMTLVTARVAAVMKSILDEYHDSNPTIGYPADQESFGAAIQEDEPFSWIVSNRWHLEAVDTYTRVAENKVELTFAGCNITYTLTYDELTIERSARSC